MTDLDVAAVLPSVCRMARRTPLARNTVMDVSDMEEDAIVGVLSAARSFDPARGASFATHAYLRARGAVLDGQRGMDHVPRTWRAAQRRAVRARTALVAELTREPTPEELADRLEVSTQQLRDIEERCRPPANLAEPLKGQSADGEQLTLADQVPDEDALPEDAVLAREDAARVHVAIAQLPPREQFAVRATWFSGMKAQEVGDILGVSTSDLMVLGAGAVAAIP